MKKVLFSLLIIAGTMSCKKDQARPVCYVCEDALGQDFGESCGSSADDARSNVTGSINGVTYTHGTYPESEFNRFCHLKP